MTLLHLLQHARTLILTFAVAVVASVSPAKAASDINNACIIFQERTGWFTAASDVSEKWGVPVPVILAVMHQESRFKASAAAETSSAYGFAQVLDGTWAWYKRAANASTAKRTNFADSANFIAWYMVQTKKKVGLPINDVASHYIAYHEGHSGYRSIRWANNSRLLNISHKVARVAATYEQQLYGCDLPHPTSLNAALVSAPRPAAKPFALAKVTATLPRRKPIDALVAEADTPSANRAGAVRWQ